MKDEGSTKQWSLPFSCGLMIVLIVLGLAWNLVELYLPRLEASSLGDVRQILSAVLWSAGVLIAILALRHMKDVFTAPLEVEVTSAEGDDQKVQRRDDLAAIRRVMRFGYSAMITALLLSLLLFMVPFIWTSSQQSFTQSPIGVIKGCRHYPPEIGSTLISQVDDPLSCAIHGPQWVLNIGGTLVPLADNAKPAGTQPGVSQPGDVGNQDQSKTPAAADLSACSLTGERANDCGFAIRGGLVLPLYMIVFSLFGGAISMTRRLPEYQRRVTEAYRDDYKNESKLYPNLQPPITPESLREFVVFQIMQTLSAPLIAATIYSLLEPSNQAAIVVIGFTAGFASELILMRLRELTDSLSGTMKLRSDAIPQGAGGVDGAHGDANDEGGSEHDRGEDHEQREPSISPSGNMEAVPEERSGARRHGGSPGGRRERVRRRPIREDGVNGLDRSSPTP